jgi:hypothetical protein
MGMSPKFWTVNGLSVELGLDRRSLAVRLASTPPDSEIQGRPAWLLRTVLGALGQATRPQSELDVERARLAREQADGHALKNAALRGELLPADEVVAGWQAAIGRARSLLLGIPPASAATVVLLARQGVDAAAAERAVREHLITSIDSALAELATTSIDGFDDEDSG